MSQAPRLSTTAIRLLAVTALSFSMLSACGKAEESATDAATEAATESAIEAMTGADVDIEDGGDTITGVDEKGQAFSVRQGNAATVPEGFPKDVLVPEELVLDSALVIDASMMVAGSMPGEMAEVSASVSAAMTDAGWTSAMTFQDAETTSQVWQQGERSVSYMLERKPDGGVGVAISYSDATKAVEDAVSGA